ncbi:protein BIC1 [Cannabis sativa]|uniref:protein BIC1 n=1 Tax=Cannabis sativa TaxID=3483 RepID=UPI0029CA61DF|nr:protein BIC1 [Cannabis sativa]
MKQQAEATLTKMAQHHHHPQLQLIDGEDRTFERRQSPKTDNQNEEDAEKPLEVVSNSSSSSSSSSNNNSKEKKSLVRCEEREWSDNGRERLKRHRIEMGGRVWIPDIWGQEDLLKDWIDCNAFDSCLGPNGLISAARASLVKQGRTATSQPLKIQNRCI